MNHIHHLIWSELLEAWVAVAELARGRGKGSGRRLVAAALSLCAATVQAAPVGGQLVSGVGSISQAGTTTTIWQSSRNLSLDWASFNVAPQETVNFVQPSAAAIAVNRILDTNGTHILGQLSANGQVWLVNPNGILFGQGARVDVGGLVASTLQPGNAGPDGSAKSFSGSGTGGIVNRGTINAASGGYVALLGNTVSNQGTIGARLGTVALGAGSAATLTFTGNSLVRMQVDQSVLATLAANGGLINADGGTVLMNAGARNALLASVVNNTGVIEARTVDNREGVIILLGGMKAGTVNVGGRLDASAPDGGNGGFIETSAGQVKVANDTRVTTAAPAGRYGTWLIDPQDYTVAAAGGDISGATLSANLGTTPVILESSGGGTVGSGNVNVNDPVAWSANTTLTLTASNNVNINASIAASGATAGLAIQPGTANGGEPASAMGVYSLNNGASVTLSGANPSLSIAGAAYTVINSLGIEADATAAPGTPTLQGMAAAANLAGRYALGSNIDAAATSAWNAGAGFTPAGDLAAQFTGTFDGLGHTISNLVINRPATNFVGLFGYHAGPAIRDVGLAGGSVSGNDAVGALVGYKFGGTVSNSYSTGGVTGVRTTGGLLGYNNAASVRDSYATGSVSGSFSFPVGGLVGQAMGGTISDSYATGNVSGTGSVGGLVGLAQTGSTVSNSSATGNVSVTGTSKNAGGLVAYNNASTVSNSSATGSVTATGSDSNVGGLVGLIMTGTVSDSSATGNVSGTGSASNVGGLVGWVIVSGAVGNSFATGDVAGNGSVGGLVGHNASFGGASITSSHARGVVSGTGFVGGLVGTNEATGSIGSSNHAAGTVSGSGASDYVGGLVGFNRGTISNSHAKSDTSASGLSGYTGGLVGNNFGTVTTSYAHGSVTGTGNAGGLVGGNSGAVSISYAAGSVSGTGDYIGGLVGENYGTITDAYATGGVAGAGSVGGLAGVSYNSVSNTYAAGSVSGTSAAGGLVGTNDGAAVIGNSYWNSEVNPVGTIGVGSGPGSATGMTIAQMRQQGSFSSSWDFTNTWIAYNGFAYPLLRYFMTPLTVTADNVAKTYDGLSANPTGVAYSTVPNANLLGTLGYGGAKDVGSYAPGGLFSNQHGYMISYVDGQLTIAPYAVSLTGSRVYDGTLNVAAGALTLGVLANGETLALSGIGTVGDKNVGALKALTLGTLVLGNGTGLASNYTFSGGTQTADITRAALTLGTSDVVKPYDGGLTAAGTAIVAGGTLYTGAGDSLSGGTFAFTDKNAGSGTKTVTTAGVTVGDGINNGNYNVSYVDNTTSTINKVPATVTANSDTRTYTGLSQSVSGFTATGLVNNEAASVLTGVTAAGASGTNAGSYTATAGVGSYSGNYTLSFVDGALTITPAPLTVTANPDSKTFNAVAYSGGNGVAYSGFVNGETPAVLVGTLSYGGTSQGAINAGSYAIAPGGISSGNYTIGYVNGLLTIAPAPITAEPTAITGALTGRVDKVYDGTTVATLTPANYVLTGWVAGDGATVTKTAGTYDSAGTGTGKAVTVSLGSSDYAPTGSSVLSNYTLPTALTGKVGAITAAPLTVTANPDSKTFNAVAYSGGNGVAYSGFVNGETPAVLVGTLSYGGTSQGAINAGSYAIAPGGLTSGNYTVGYVNGLLTIRPAPLAALIGALTNQVDKVYDGTTVATLAPTNYLLTGWMAGDGATVTRTVGAYDTANTGSGKTVSVTLTNGDYAPTGSSVLSNYTLPTALTGKVGAITAAPLTVTANPDSKTFNAVAYSGGNGVAYSGFVNGETPAVLVGTLSYGGTSQGAINAGSYAIAPGGISSGNYTVGYVNGILTIAPVVQTPQPVIPPGPGPTPPGPAVIPSEPDLTSSGRVLSASAQIQSELTVFNVLDQHQTLLLSPTIGGEANSYLKEVVVVGNKETRINIGGLGPVLRVVNGGVKLPGNLVLVDE